MCVVDIFMQVCGVSIFMYIHVRTIHVRVRYLCLCVRTCVHGMNVTHMHVCGGGTHTTHVSR